jgi:leucyl/phenylalanyl-tRNA--protein transferase
MRSYLNQEKYTISYDQSFSDVITACQSINRKGQDSTWIIPELKSSMIELHEMGYAHSVEVWDGDDLVGGLYGLALGRMFFGESMFARKSNASKFALIKLCQRLTKEGFTMIDCQQETAHTISMGAEMLSKESFYKVIKNNLLENTRVGKWT